MSKHPIVHIELSSHDHEVNARFYSELFEWKFTQYPESQYATFEAEGGPGGGLAAISESNPAGKILIYVATDDVDATLAKAEALGGKALVPKTEIPDVGYFGIIQDLAGNQIAVLHPFEM